MQKADKKIKDEVAKLLGKENDKPYPYWRVMLKKLRWKLFMKKEK